MTCLASVTALFIPKLCPCITSIIHCIHPYVHLPLVCLPPYLPLLRTSTHPSLTRPFIQLPISYLSVSPSRSLPHLSIYLFLCLLSQWASLPGMMRGERTGWHLHSTTASVGKFPDTEPRMVSFNITRQGISSQRKLPSTHPKFTIKNNGHVSS